MVRVLVDTKRMNPVFQQNYDRILLDIAFARSEPGGNSKLHHLLEHAKKRIKDASCFTTLKGYLELLTTEEVSNFMDAWEADCSEDAPVSESCHNTTDASNISRVLPCLINCF